MGWTGNGALNKRIGDFSFSLPYNCVVGVLDSAPVFWQFVMEKYGVGEVVRGHPLVENIINITAICGLVMIAVDEYHRPPLSVISL